MKEETLEVAMEPSSKGLVLYTKEGRPVGITILMILHMLGGMALLILTIVFSVFDLPAEATSAFADIGFSKVMLILGVFFLTVLGMASAIGMSIGAKWGWWLGAFYYIYSLFRNASAILTIYALSDQIDLEGADRGPSYYYFKHGLRILIHLLIFCYFFKENVLEFFEMKGLNKKRAVAIMTGVCIAITTLFTIWSFTI